MTKTEDEGIAPGQWEDLNRIFYDRKTGPHTYIVARLNALDQMDDDAKVVESVNLLHHAAEALLRQYLAHRGAPDCPWLENARQRSPVEFKAAVSELRDASGPGYREELVDVFCGPVAGRTPAAMANIALAGDGLKALLAYAADILLDEAGMYNAVKHGLAAVPGTRRIPPEVLAAGGGAIMRGDGLSLLTLEPVGEGGERRWAVVIRYIDVAENAAITDLIGQQLENLWAVARARYVGAPMGRLHPVTQEMAHRARCAEGLDAPPTLLTVAVSLKYLAG
ncbi:MAG: hypothetical protein HGA51_05455 [Demequinaceae bacterium]|nr:hypothetical protein [Demequinaceae bacterium]